MVKFLDIVKCYDILVADSKHNNKTMYSTKVDSKSKMFII